jgi:gamma-tubulin complex component 4
MLHELLLALLGRTGDIVIEQDGTFRIDPKIDFISEPEKDILNKICTLGFYYMKI